jgi:phage shock protein A
MGTFSRLRYVIAANVNALLEKAEDPEKLLRALIREMEDASEEARLAGAELLAEQQRLQRLHEQLGSDMEPWPERARRAVEEHRDDLARAALKAHADLAQRREAVAAELAAVKQRIGQMELDMTTLKGKLAEAKLRLKGIHGRSAVRDAGKAAAVSPTEKRVQQALGRFDRLQNQVENLEARVRSYQLGGPSPAVWQRQEEAVNPAIEEELQRLKARLGQAAGPGQADAAV